MYFKIPQFIKVCYLKEISEHHLHFDNKDYAASWRSLERSHILGQTFPFEHTFFHWLRLKFGFKTKNLKELVGQFLRLLVGGVKSFAGVIPVGNIGGANVPPLKSMEN